MSKESYNIEKLRSHQLKLLEILSYFKTICENYKLTYYFVGGSVLGSIRHQGFIPWDDDIDIGLPREDFNKLESILAFDTESDFVYITADKPTFPHPPFGVLSYKIGNSLAPGIDIYPLDGVPSSRALQYVQKYAADFYHLAVYREVPVNRGRLAATIVKIILRFLPDAIIQIIGDIGKQITMLWSFENSSLVANIFGLAGYKREIMPKEYFGAGIQSKFESQDHYIPSLPDLYLKHLYGDYMRLPSKEKQLPSHGEFL